LRYTAFCAYQLTGTIRGRRADIERYCRRLFTNAFVRKPWRNRLGEKSLSSSQRLSGCIRSLWITHFSLGIWSWNLFECSTNWAILPHGCRHCFLPHVLFVFRKWPVKPGTLGVFVCECEYCHRCGWRGQFFVIQNLI